MGPLILVWGSRLQAIVMLLNAAFAANLFGIVEELENVESFSELDLSVPRRLANVLLAGMLIQNGFAYIPVEEDMQM